MNKKLIWTKIQMRAFYASLVFGAIVSAPQHEYQAEVEHQNIWDCGLEVIMDYIVLFKIILAIILQYFEVVLQTLQQ